MRNIPIISFVIDSSTPICWGPHPTFPGRVYEFYGRFQQELGCPDAGFLDFGYWTCSEYKLINTLELKGVILAPITVTDLRGHQLMIATDNTTVVAYINKQGGTPFQCTVMSSTGSVPMATNSRHSQTHSGLSKRDKSSGPPISAEPAHNNRVKAPPRNSDSGPPRRAK